MCSAKRENSNLVFQSNCIILDIEGTTTSITFVKDVLFPYVRKHLDTFVQENWDSECFQEIVKALRIQAKEDKEKNLDGVIDIPENGEKDEMVKAVIQNVLWQMDLDSKAKSLKELQGLIMEIGYKNGEIKGHVYEDVEPNLKMWTDLGKDVYIYSSGSVYAQKLLYGHSEKGDLLPFIRGHFDTTVGKKGEVESYKKIVEQISSSPSETVFFTDVPNEAKAAKEAGLSAILLSREGNAPLTDEDTKMFQVIKSFSEIQFENNSKKRKICTKKDTENENKIVKPCGVSLKSLKEPSHSPLIKEPDVIMEVEESNIEEENLNLEKSNEKLNTEFCENGDVEMNAVIAVNEKNESTTQDDNAVSDTNKEKLQRKTPEDLKFESEEHDTKKKVSEDKPSAFIQDKQNKSEPVCDRIESENIVKESTTTNNETKEKCKSFQEVIHVDANKPRIISGNKEVTEVETVDVNPKCEVQHNGGSESNFSNEVETSKDTSLEKQNNEDSPINIRTEKSSECLNGIHSPKLVVGDKENTPSKLDLLKDSKVHTNDKSMIGNQKQPESEQFSDRDNYNAEISKMPNSSENYKGMDDEPSPIVNDDVNNVTSPEDNAAVITDVAASKATVNEVENSSDVIQTESEKECPTLTFDSTSCHTTEEAIDKAKKDDATLENIQSDEIKTEEISCDSEKHTTIEGRAVTLNDVDSNLNPCVDIKATKSVSESVSKQQIVCESDSVETKSEKIEMDEGSIQMSKEVKDSGEKEAESEKMKMDEEVVLISNMVNGSPEKAGSEKVEMTKGNVHNMGSGEEAAKTEKMELDEESVQNSKRGNSHEEAKSEKMELDEENSQTSKEVNDSHKETAKSEEMEMDDGNSVTGKEVNDSDEEKKSGNVLSVKLPEVSKLNESSDFNTNAHLDKVSFSETQNHSDTENSEQDRVKEMSNKVKLSQITNEKLTEESDFIPHANDLTAASEIKNDTTDDISKEHDTNETMKSNNEKMGDNSESIEHRHDQGVKNEIEEDAVSEVKKFEVPENTVITAVVEA